jgi:predicted AlkP superfamily phosphohydrolase/phosphomutase
MLSNSVVAGALATGYVLVLLLHLNPRLQIEPRQLTSLSATVGLFYLIHFTALFYVLLVLWQLVAREVFSPAWLSVRVLARLAALSAAAAALLVWANLRTFEIVLEPETVKAMMDGTAALAGACALFAAVALVYKLTAPRLAALWGLAWLLIAATSLAVPLLLRGPAQPSPLEARPLGEIFDESAGVPSPRAIVIALDGGSLELIARAASEGRLPNFGRLLDSGAIMHLATLHPTSAEAVWSAVATGKLPQKNGVRSAGIYRLSSGGEEVRLLPDYCFASTLVRFGFLTEEPYTSAMMRARPLWSILSLQGRTVGVVNWPLTYPAPPVRGYVVSDRYAHVLSAAGAVVDQAMLYPADLRGEVTATTQASLDELSIAPARLESILPERHQLPGRTDRVYRGVARALNQSRPTDVTLARYQSTDPIGHYFLRYAAPAAFGNVTQEERKRYGSVLESHYALIDEAIGRAIEEIGPEGLLLVVSGYGMEPLGLGKRMLERMIGDPEVNGTHESAPDGFLMAYGASVTSGRLPRTSVVDVVPTLLYFLGLPIGRDMDGYARTDMFRREFTEGRPITFIPTYDR